VGAIAILREEERVSFEMVFAIVTWVVVYLEALVDCLYGIDYCYYYCR